MYEKTTKNCELHTGIYGIEYDRDETQKVIGPVDGCIGNCNLAGWDYTYYSSESLVGNHGIGMSFIKYLWGYRQNMFYTKKKSHN